MGRFPIKVTSLGKQIKILSKRVKRVESVGEEQVSIFIGRGPEFKGHREYSPGEDARYLDWKASLRSDDLLIKEFFLERGRDIIFVYDVSDSMLFGSQKKIKAHYGAEFVLALASTAMEAGNNIGLICASDKVNIMIPPTSSNKQLWLFIKLLGEHSTYGGKLDVKKTFDFIEGNFKKNSMVFLVSDFLGFSNQAELIKKRMERVAMKFDLVSVIIRDPRDEFMPKENINIVIADPRNDREITVNTKAIRKDFEKEAKVQKDRLKKILKDTHSEYFELYTDKTFVNPTVLFFKRREALLK